MKGGWIPAVAGMSVFFLHYVGTFMSWSLTFGHSAASHAGDVMARLWPVLSFPLFAVLPGPTLDANWSIVMLANSAMWAAGAYAAAAAANGAVRRPASRKG